MFAPVLIFTYSRVFHTRQLIDSLKKCQGIENTDIFVFSDGNKNENDYEKVKEVREYLDTLVDCLWCKSIVIKKSTNNKGLAASIISGVKEIIDLYGRVIVLEDDLVVSKGFLKYMNEALACYEKEDNVWAISGFSSAIPILEESKDDVYFSCRARSWSWATWKNRWDTVDWDVKSYKKFKYNLFDRWHFNRGGRDMAAMLDRQQAGVINSWAIRWCFNQFLQKKYVVQPTRSLIVNKGQDGSGTNCSVLKEENDISETKMEWNFKPFLYDPNIDYHLAKRKRIPYYKLIGSYIIYVVLGINKTKN